MAGIFNSSIFNNAVFNTNTGVVEIVDTHDGGKRDAARRSATERLREQIRLALEGPKHEQVEAVIESYEATPDVVESIDWNALLADLESVERIRQAALAAELEQDDEEVLLLA